MIPGGIMKTMFLGCMLALFAIFSVGQADYIDGVDTAVAVADVNNDEELRTPMAYSGAILDEVHRIAIRATGEDTEHAEGLVRIMQHARRVAELAKVVKERDVHGGVQMVKKAIIDFLDYKN